MAESISPIPQPPPSHPALRSAPNVPALSKQMRDQVLNLADHLQKIMDDPTLATQQSFLNEFASNASNLDRTVDQAILVR